MQPQNQTDDIRDYFRYHLIINRLIWEKGVLALTDAAFLQPDPYSVGSVRDHLVHMAAVEQQWLSGLVHRPRPAFLNSGDYPNRLAVRALLDEGEAAWDAYFAAVTDAELAEPFDSPVNAHGTPITVRRVLMHIVNHGTDHRAQLLVLLNRLGVKTAGQDYAYFLFNRLDAQWAAVV